MRSRHDHPSDSLWERPRCDPRYRFQTRAQIDEQSHQMYRMHQYAGRKYS